MRLVNLALLIGGYGLGQGGVFLAQTWLITRGQLDLVADFGVSFYMATLGIMLVDFGSTAVLARETAAKAHLRASDATGHSIWADYWAITPARAAMAFVVLLGGAAAAALSEDPFSRAYALFAWPALVLWAFNATGLLDGLRLSGMNGLTGALPFILSAAILAGVADQPPAVAGAALGAALSAGYLLGVIGQVIALRMTGHAPRWQRPSQKIIAHVTYRCIGSLFSLLPGQLYFRAQILLAGLIVGPAGVALLVYAKQVSTGFSQLIGFLRRIEFPNLVGRLRDMSSLEIKTIFSTQRVGTSAAAASSFIVLIAGIAGSIFFDAETSEAAIYVAIFSPTIFSGAISLMFTQSLIATGMYGTAAKIMVACTALSILVSTTLLMIPGSGIEIFAMGDIFLHLLVVISSILAIRRVNTARPVQS